MFYSDSQPVGPTPPLGWGGGRDGWGGVEQLFYRGHISDIHHLIYLHYDS